MGPQRPPVCARQCLPITKWVAPAGRLTRWEVALRATSVHFVGVVPDVHDCHPTRARGPIFTRPLSLLVFDEAPHRRSIALL